MKMYLIFVDFSFKKRNRRFNVFYFIFKSHKSNFANVIVAMQSILTNLKTEKFFKFDDEKQNFLCVFTLCFLNDMSQQNENFEFLNQRVNLKCRFCFVEIKNRNNVEYDTLRNEKFHHEKAYD